MKQSELQVGEGYAWQDRENWASAMTGWAYDPDSAATSIAVRVYEGSTLRARAGATRARLDVDRALRIGGNHGFAFTFGARPGAHTYCVRAENYGGGLGPAACYRVTVAG